MPKYHHLKLHLERLLNRMYSDSEHTVDLDEALRQASEIEVDEGVVPKDLRKPTDG